MKKLTILSIMIVAAFVCFHFKESSNRAAGGETWPDWKRISPFTAVEFKKQKIIVEYERNLYELIAIEGIARDELIQVSKRHYGDLWQKRIREDIAEVLIAAGASDSTSVNLTLIEIDSGETISVDGAEMTAANRAMIYRNSPPVYLETGGIQ